MSQSTQSRTKSKSKSSITQHSDLEDASCVLCLKPAVRKHSKKRQRQKVKYLFTICCKVLKIKESDPIGRFSKELAFCMGCQCILKDCDALFAKLEEIQTSLKKFEIDMKTTVVKSQHYPPSLVPISDNSNSNHYQEFRHRAIKDFSPDLKLLNVSTARNRKCQTKIALSEKMAEIKKEDYKKPDDIEIKQENYYIEDGVHNSPFSNLDSDGGWDWQNEVDNKVHGSAETENKLYLSVSTAHNVNNMDTDTGIEQNAFEATIDSDIESKLNEDRKHDLKEKQDPEYTKSRSSDSSDEVYTPSKTKKQKISSRSKSKPTPKLKTIPKNIGKRTQTLTDEAKPNISTAHDTPKVKKRSTKQFCARLKQSDGVEFKISDNKWSYRSIEYSFNEEKQYFECTVCDKTTILQLKMRSHIGNIHGVDERYGKWHYGGVKYSYDKERKRFVCSECNKDFSSRNTVGEHIKIIHHDIVEANKLGRKRIDPPPRKAPRQKPVDLGDGKWLFKNVEFTKDETGYTCSVCKRFRKGWHSMLLHICECHNDEASKLKNQCPHCGKCFGTKYRLKDHLPVHSVEKSQYQCTECGDFFRSSNSLWGHVARVHEKRRPYICEYCGKSFFNRKDCQIHVRVHTKERPYVCTYDGCGNMFSLSATLKSHQKSRGHDLEAPVALTSLQD